MTAGLTGLVVAVIALAGAVLLRRARAPARRSRAAEAGLEMTIDLISVVLGSGGTVGQAITTVAASGPDPVRSSFQAVLHRSARGRLMADALGPLSVELGPAFHPLTGALIGVERDGASVSALLQRLADEADQARRWRAEAVAKRLPVALLVPLVICLLPAAIVGAVVPLAIVAVRQLG